MKAFRNMWKKEKEIKLKLNSLFEGLFENAKKNNVLIFLCRIFAEKIQCF